MSQSQQVEVHMASQEYLLTFPFLSHISNIGFTAVASILKCVEISPIDALFLFSRYFFICNGSIFTHL